MGDYSRGLGPRSGICMRARACRFGRSRTSEYCARYGRAGRGHGWAAEVCAGPQARYVFDGFEPDAGPPRDGSFGIGRPSYWRGRHGSGVSTRRPGDHLARPRTGIRQGPLDGHRSPCRSTMRPLSRQALGVRYSATRESRLGVIYALTGPGAGYAVRVEILNKLLKDKKSYSHPAPGGGAPASSPPEPSSPRYSPTVRASATPTAPST
jgi:hypothetical protein